MPDLSRTPHGLLERAAAAGVPPLLLSGSPWAICRDMLHQVMQAARFPEAAALSALTNGRSTEQPVRRVAVVPLTGVITPQGSFFDVLFGGAGGGLMGFREAFDEALASSDVEAVVIDMDSPGGLVDLVPETAQHVRDSRGSKPIVAVADTLMASAAYWIGSQADEIVITPSGYAGSIGVYRVHVDESGLNDQLGLKVTYVSAGKYKTEGNSEEPLEGEALADWQQNVDDAYAAFVDDVAAGRGTSAEAVASGYGEGRVLNARRALAAGIVDRVDTYEGTIGRLLGAPDPVAVDAVAFAEQLAAEQAANTTLRAELAALREPPDTDPVDGPVTVLLTPEDRRAIAALLTS